MNTDTTEQQAVRSVLDQWAAAIRDVDLDGVMANHTEDLVMYDVPPPFRNDGLEAYRASWDLFYRYSDGGPDSFRLTDVVTEVGDTVAFAHATINIADFRCRLSVGLRKVDGAWLISHEHHSSPSEAPA